MSFKVKAIGGSRAIDRIEVRRSLEILIGPNEHHELRGLGKSAAGDSWARSRLIHEGEWEAALEAAHSLSDGIGVYYTLNPVQSTLGDRSANAKHVVSRRWLLVDVDRKKDVEPDQCATEQERNAAFSLAMCCHDWLIGEGWPGAVLIDSGNGAQMLYRVDLPAERLAHLLIQRVLNSLADRWSSAGAEIDIKVFDAPRIARLPGTWNRKGISTEDRPYRLCRLLHVPDPIEIVTVEQLEAVAGDKRPTPQTFNPWAIKVPTGAPDKLQSYVRSAIERELARVVLANPGTRNDALNTASFAIGQLVGAHAADQSDVEKQLTTAALRTGLGETEIAQTLRSGIEAGIKEPRTLPPSLMGEKRNGHATKAAVLSGASPIIWGSSIKPKKVEWLWPGRIPVGKQTTFAGQTGMGKTFTVCDIAARITREMEIPFGGGMCFRQGTVLMISAEDDADDTIMPRFLELGGDPSRIAFLSPESEEHFSLAALDLLNKSLDAMGPDVRMVAIDPPTSYLGSTDDHKNAELRGLLGPLKRWAAQREIALIFVTHVNKAGGQKIDAMARVIGSVAWVAAVRAAHMFCADPDTPERNLFVPLKVNNAKKGKTLSYVVESTKDDLAILKWIEELDMTADEAMGNVKRKSRGVVATEWLADRFREKSEWQSDELKRLASDAGISKNALWSPEVNALPIQKKKRVDASGDTYYVWRAVEGWPGEIVGKPGNPGNPDTQPF